MPDGGGQTSTTTSSSGPPAYLEPYMKFGAQQGQALYNSSQPAYYPGSTVANQSPQTQAANQGIAARAANGSPVNAAANQFTTGLLGGDYLRAGNPHQAALNKSIGDSVIPMVESQFSSAGRYGSPAMAGAMTSALANAIAPQAYGTYNNTLGLMNSGAYNAPNLANQDYMDLGQLGQVGKNQDAYGQQQVNAGVDKWNYNNNLQYNKLAQYMGLLSGNNFGTTGTSTQTQPGGGPLGFLGGLLG